MFNKFIGKNVLQKCYVVIFIYFVIFPGWFFSPKYLFCYYNLGLWFLKLFVVAVVVVAIVVVVVVRFPKFGFEIMEHLGVGWELEQV